MRALNLPAGVDPVDPAAHADVHHNHVRPERGSRGNGRLAVTSLAGDLHVVLKFEHGPQASPHDFVVINEEDAYHWAAPLRGISTATVVPASGAERRAAEPPSASARSRMFARPGPAGPAPGSNPCPSSRRITPSVPAP